MSEAAPPLLSADTPEVLPVGTRVAEFEVRRLLGSGGFGIVYLAWDHALEREVALKEYMPGTLAGRGAGLQVSVRSAATVETFALGLRSFVNEARLLARFDHPSLVKVYRFWEDNGTAYMVMPHYAGRTLRQARLGMVVPPGETACRRVLDALLSALEVLHREGVYHRDIAPDNILIGDDGLPVLLDFGAARRVLGDSTQALTSIMKPHYAPLEQYADSQTMRQGPWTDLYALGGTMYFLITGQTPVAAASRALHDDQPRLATLRSRDCSPGLLAAVDWMLALKPPERPQSVHMLRDVLEGRITLPGRQAADKTVPGVAARDGGAAPLPPRTDIDLSDSGNGNGNGNDSGNSNSNSGGSSSGGEPVVAAAIAAPAAGRAAAVTVLQTPTAAPAVPPTTRPQALAAAPTALKVDRAADRLRHSPTLRWLLAALLLFNALAWWWTTRPAATPAPESAAAAPLVVPAAAAVATTADKSPVPVDTAASETILSVLPARNVAARAVPASAAVPRAPDAAAPANVRPRNPNEATATAVLAAGAGPRARCGERNFLSMLICVKRECEAPALHGHPECVKMREQEEAQRDRRQ